MTWKTELKTALKSNFNGKVVFDEPLSAYTSYQVGGPTELLLEPYDLASLQTGLAQVFQQGLAYRVIGNGTNVLVSDQGIPGIVIRIGANLNQIKVVAVMASTVNLSVEAGGMLSALLTFCSEQALTGFEFAAGIPGNVGGAIIMNAGTQLGQMSDVLLRVSLVRPTGELISIERDQMGFSYRKSCLPQAGIIASADLQLKKATTESEREVSKNQVREILLKRQTRMPIDLPSAGSVFKNPPGLYAAKVIEECGLKGKRIGGAKVSEVHANFIVNDQGATASDIYRLMNFVIREVQATRGISLEREVVLMGAFEE